ncbi:hypothetical protein BC826DRAFT_1176352 [Russula brevipes]|nr:hypothetical protein BC826DRAFT_1176352 [Russula brevipes]
MVGRSLLQRAATLPASLIVALSTVACSASVDRFHVGQLALCVASTVHGCNATDHPILQCTTSVGLLLWPPEMTLRALKL